MLRVEAPHFVAGAIFKKSVEGWKVARTAPILAWLHKMRLEEIPTYLKRKGCKHEWLTPDTPEGTEQ